MFPTGSAMKSNQNFKFRNIVKKVWYSTSIALRGAYIKVTQCIHYKKQSHLIDYRRQKPMANTKNTDRVLSFDFGNRFVKYATDEVEDSFLHAHKELSVADYEKATLRGDDKDIFTINGKHYRFGYYAEADSQPKHGEARYRDPEYYQAFLGVALFNAFSKGRKDVTLFAGHPPQDLNSRPVIESSAMSSDIEVEHRGKTKVFRVKNVGCWDEPIGGIMNQILTATGNRYKDSEFKLGRTLVIDIGGLTTDFAMIENNAVKADELDSYRTVKLIDIERNLYYQLKKYHPKVVNNVGADDIKHELRQAMITNHYVNGVHDIDISEIIDQELKQLVIAIREVYDSRGGDNRIKNIVLTGGGAHLLEYRLRVPLNRPNGKGIFLAGERNRIELANVLGAHKLATLYVNHGKL